MTPTKGFTHSTPLVRNTNSPPQQTYFPSHFLTYPTIQEVQETGESSASSASSYDDADMHIKVIGVTEAIAREAMLQEKEDQEKKEREEKFKWDVSVNLPQSPSSQRVSAPQTHSPQTSSELPSSLLVPLFPPVPPGPGDHSS